MRIELPIAEGKWLTSTIRTTWNKLTLEESGLCLAVFEAPTPLMQGEEARFWKRLQIFKALTRWKDADLNSWQALHIAQEGNTMETWFFELREMVHTATAELVIEDGEGISIKPGMTKNPLPWLKMPDEKGSIAKYYAAHSTDEDPLSKISLDEMSQLFTLYEDWRSSGDVGHLNRLIAILYRKPKEKTPENIKRNYDGDIRKPLENYDAAIDRRAALIEKNVPTHAKRVIAFHIASCRARMAELYPDLFSRNSGNTEGGDWLDFVLELGDYDITKNEAVLRQDAHDALTVAERLVKQSKRKKPTTTQ